jgi:hypothetical protein
VQQQMLFGVVCKAASTCAMQHCGPLSVEAPTAWGFSSSTRYNLGYLCLQAHTHSLDLQFMNSNAAITNQAAHCAPLFTPCSWCMILMQLLQDPC